jgi:hypothetical protein
MSTTSTSTADFIYKTKFEGIAHEEERRHPTLNDIKKVGGLANENKYVVAYGDGQGAGGVFATAQTNVSPVKGVQFNMRPKIDYRIAQVDGPSLQLSMGDANAFEELVVAELRGSLNGFNNDLGLFLFGDGTGARGVRSGALSGNIVTLADPKTARNFFEGMTVVAGTSTTSLRSGTTTVAAVDYDAGKVTLTDASLILSFTAGDILFRQGETGNTMMEGFESINPLTVPVYLTDSFRGVDRGKNPALLAGSRIAADGSTPEELALRLAAAIFDAGGSADTWVLSPSNAQAVCNRGSAKITYPDGGGVMTFGFTGAVLQSPAGQLRLVSDPDCPNNRGRVYKKGIFEIVHAGRTLIHSAFDDSPKFSGRFWYPKDTSDTIEGRWRSICNLKCKSPRDMGVHEVA